MKGTWRAMTIYVIKEENGKVIVENYDLLAKGFKPTDLRSLNPGDLLSSVDNKIT